ncbi:MAG: hypothetical protein ACI9GB_003602 [Halioglobus sp.]|jgi:hypothetical protein
MIIQKVLSSVIVLVVACWTQTSSAAEGDSAAQVLEAYVSAAVSTVNTIYETRPDALQRSTMIGQAGLDQYWVVSKKTTMEAKGHGAAFAQVLGFRADAWTLGEFRQAGDFGEIEVELSRTKTFRSGEQSTATLALMYEMIKVENGWLIAVFRKIEQADIEVEARHEKFANVDMPTEGAGPEAVAKAQLDLLQGLPPQALSSASEQSAALWQDTREARKGQGRVIAMVMAVSSFNPDPVVWNISVLDQAPNAATVKAEIVSDKPLAFKALVFTLEKTGAKWLLSTAVATQ